MNKVITTSTSSQSATRWRRPPIYAATRLRCAVAMLVFAAAVLLSAIPSLAEAGCDSAQSLETCFSVALTSMP